MQVALVLGTRPEIIKLSPVVEALNALTVSQGIIHTGQHYDREMDSAHFEELCLPQPVTNLKIHSHGRGGRTGLMVQGVWDVLSKLRPGIVVVQGDTDSALAGALGAVKLKIPVAHVEAGLRSFDRTMPEEVNRVLIDHMSDLLFAPTETSAANLESEGLYRGVRVVGNTVVDALQQMGPPGQLESQWTRQLPATFILATIHRHSNVDDAGRLRALLDGLRTISERVSLPVVFPLHPRTRIRAASLDLLGAMEGDSRFVLSPPLPRSDFVATLSRAAVAITDSGGVQEEGCALEVPTVTVRSSTERPETIAVGANVLAPTPTEMVTAALAAVRQGRGRWPNPFGSGNTGTIIADALNDFSELRPPEGEPLRRMH